MADPKEHRANPLATAQLRIKKLEDENERLLLEIEQIREGRAITQALWDKSIDQNERLRALINTDKQWPAHCAWCGRKLKRGWTFVAGLPNCGRFHHERANVPTSRPSR